MKTIVFLSSQVYNYFFPEKSKCFGGVSRIYRVVRWLEKNSSYNIKCIVGNYGQPKIQKSGQVILVKCRIGNYLNIFQIYSMLRELRPELIVEFYPSARLFLLGLLNLFHGQRIVYFTGSDIDVDGRYRSLTNPLFYRLYVWGLRRVNRIICQTEKQASLLYDTYGLHGQVVLSPYLKIAPLIVREREFFLWVGRSSAYKRPDLFLELAAKIPQEKFVMICNPGQHGCDMYRGVSRRSERMSNVVFIPSVSPEKMAVYYAGAKFLVNTSDFEGFPNTFVEAGMQETPIVSLNADPNGILSQYHAGFFCNGVFYRLVEYCKEFSDNTEKRYEMGKNARFYSETHHNIDRAMEKLVRHFDQVMESDG